MGAEENGLSLEGLAHKLEMLQRENAERLETLERENAELRDEVSALRGSGARQDELPALRGSDTRRNGQAVSEFAGQMSRRSLISKAGAAAVAAVAAGTLLGTRQAKANHFANGIQVDFVTTHIEIPNAVAVVGESTQGIGVRGKGSNFGVRGEGSKAGVWGQTSETGYEGVYGQHTGTSGYGVVGDGTGSGSGVLGKAPIGTGVRGEGGTGVWGVGSDDQQAGVKGEGPTGVWGLTSRTSFAGVYGEHTGTFGIGTVGIGKGNTAGVLGKNTNGIGVRGDGRTGVHGKASNTGYGGFFEGGKAQLRIVPKGSAGAPTSGTHLKGEIYMDKAGALFVCTVGGATPTWRKVSTTAV